MDTLIEFVGIFLALMSIELIYFKIANKYNIIDKPNLRSSHSSITLRGGGIIFYFGALAYFFYSGFQYPFFFLGLTLMSLVSFLDDILTLSNKIRLMVHFGSVLLLAYQLSIFSLQWYFLLIAFIVVVGVINAYNFMDGINGMTGCYSLAIGALLTLVNMEINFIDQRLINYSVIGLLVFLIFNFRSNAKTFAGDVGAISIAYIFLFCLGTLIIKSGNFIYILFLSVYGIDAVWTILRRLHLNENIFEAHRSHLYQFLGNEAKVNKLGVSFSYGLIQVLIGLLVIYFSNYNKLIQIVFSVVLLLVMSIIYLVIKRSIINKYLIKKN
ncbi:MraY family glycosyltransferase [Sphingobacterium mizutaii]|uniref:MraY family glycosyltransferase n=1 Tax=Sphingobacterium mizutaii TaxID=1010 RepID=UPI003D9743E4